MYNQQNRLLLAKSKDSDGESAGAGKTIMCVDDNFVNLNSIRLMLEMMGF